jgi:putative protein kinase ArgK-like GTPase of G3E family
LIPGSGDSIQALKAGVMEIPDVIVVNKADHPMTDTMVREIKSVLSLAPKEQGAWKVPVIRTQAARGIGVEDLAARLAADEDATVRGAAQAARVEATAPAEAPVRAEVVVGERTVPAAAPSPAVPVQPRDPVRAALRRLVLEGGSR